MSISSWFDDRIKLAIICCFIFGILIHFTFLSEILLSQDGIWNSLGGKRPYDWEMSLGRWGIMFVDRIANFLSTPNITGIISLVLVTISTISIINLLNIKSKPGIILTAFAMMASPSLATTMEDPAYTNLSENDKKVLACLDKAGKLCYPKCGSQHVRAKPDSSEDGALERFSQGCEASF